jgi:uncharacterized protein (TIGR02145 family)
MIFISYSHHDIEKAKELSRALESSGLTVWWDRNIPSGRTFDDVIEEALGGAHCVIVLWSKNSVKSEWVRNEVQDGVDRKILIPVLIENVKIPLAFRRIQSANLVEWAGDVNSITFQNLVEDVKRILSQDGNNTFVKGRKILPNESLSTSDQSLTNFKQDLNQRTSKSYFGKKSILIVFLVLISIFIIVFFVIKDFGGVSDSRNNKYSTEQIGGKIWMTQNMDYEVSGSSYFPEVTSQEMKKKYGRLYTWEAANEACKLLGVGWRLPTNNDWVHLINTIGSGPEFFQESLEGGNSGFSAVLGGYLHSDGGGGYLGKYGNYWSSTRGDGFDGNENAWVYAFSGESGLHRRGDNNLNFRFSCRCVKDK